MLLDGARIGSALLGRVGGGAKWGLLRTGMCQVRIESVRMLPKGKNVGYGSLYRTPGNRLLALCPIGSHHGVGAGAHTGIQRPWQTFLSLLRFIRQHFLLRSVPMAMVQGKPCR